MPQHHNRDPSSYPGGVARGTGLNETGKNTTFYCKNLNLDQPCLKMSENAQDIAYFYTPVDLFGEVRDMR